MDGSDLRMREAASGWTGTHVAVLVVALCCLAALPRSATGQDLEGIEQLGADGRTADARDALVAWWDAAWDDASRSERERALWLRGVLTLDPVAAASTYRRLVVEYPAGGHSERALGRLGELSAAVGDTLGAARWFTMLERDYPRSTEASGASAWLTENADAVARAAARGPVPTAPAGAPVRAAPAEDTVADPPATDPPPADPPGRETTTSEQPSASVPAPEQGDWTVQLGAFSSEASARQIADEARAAGFEVRVILVEGSDLWRIRSGRFVEDDDARPLAARMVEAGFQAAVVPGADDEVGGG